MKKFSLMFLFALAVAFVSCEKSSDPSPEPSPDPKTLTGLPLVKKVFEQVSGSNALTIMGSSVYSFARKDSDNHVNEYVYKTTSDSIQIFIQNDTVVEANVMFLYPGNTIATTCVSYLENNLGSSQVVKGVTLDSVYAYVKTAKPFNTYPTSAYYLYKYQDVVDSMKYDSKMLSCGMWYYNRVLKETRGTSMITLRCERNTEANTTSLAVGYSILTGSLELHNETTTEQYAKEQEEDF